MITVSVVQAVGFFVTLLCLRWFEYQRVADDETEGAIEGVILFSLAFCWWVTLPLFAWLLLSPRGRS